MVRYASTRSTCSPREDAHSPNDATYPNTAAIPTIDRTTVDRVDKNSGTILDKREGIGCGEKMLLEYFHQARPLRK